MNNRIKQCGTVVDIHDYELQPAESTLAQLILYLDSDGLPQVQVTCNGMLDQLSALNMLAFALADILENQSDT